MKNILIKVQILNGNISKILIFGKYIKTFTQIFYTYPIMKVYNIHEHYLILRYNSRNKTLILQIIVLV